MARTGYYAIRVFDDNGKVLAERVEKSHGPRTACRMAFGVIYDRPNDTARYLFCGSTKSAVMKRIRESKPEEWKPIPTNLQQTEERLSKIRVPVAPEPEPEITIDNADSCMEVVLGYLKQQRSKNDPHVPTYCVKVIRAIMEAVE